MSFLGEKSLPPHELHLDVGCGSGQGTYNMSSHFKQVIGFDVSKAQVEVATKANIVPNVEFIVSPAEALPVKDHSVDLVTCGSAAHWFDFKAFYRECSRVLKPNGCLAVYCYGCPWLEHKDESIMKELNEDIHYLRYKALGSFWTERLFLVSNRYADLKIPFKDFVRDDTIELKFDWSVSHLIGYFISWSASQKYLAVEPSGQIFEEYQKKVLAAVATPDASPDDTVVRVAFPFFLLLGRTS